MRAAASDVARISLLIIRCWQRSGDSNAHVAFAAKDSCLKELTKRRTRKARQRERRVSIARKKSSSLMAIRGDRMNVALTTIILLAIFSWK